MGKHRRRADWNSTDHRKEHKDLTTDYRVVEPKPKKTLTPSPTGQHEFNRKKQRERRKDRIITDRIMKKAKGKKCQDIKMETPKSKPKLVVGGTARPKMTRQLAEARAVGRNRTKTFDGTAFLRSLKK